MSTGVAIACAGVAAGGLVQSATGFGFALIAAPVVAAALGPVAAVPTVALCSLVVNALTATGEGRRPEVLRRAAWILTLASVPGMALGAVVLAEAPEDVLRVIVAVVVVGSVVAVARAGAIAPRADRDGDPGGGVVAGLLAGVLATTSGVNGPAMLVHLRRVGASAAQVRDTLAVVFLATGVLTVAALAGAGALTVPSEIWLIALGAVAGQGLGRLAFRALEGHREAATRCVLALSVAAAAVPAVQALG